ncbi:hypothetical protein EV421DRAFT_124887 [Armillaria borealis]|uniref:Uncharacterized protein n=1 Tax=Armillaria borealis TaxID=47425 RepID=A0AA39IYP1_9AGAR|nr:hypothetical protein EV421DRAFT_124887 [Armillaria borealis]
MRVICFPSSWKNRPQHHWLGCCEIVSSTTTTRTTRELRLACVQPYSSPPTMADVALGLTSSVTVLIQNITTAIKCGKNIQDAPKEITQFLTELQYTEIYLSALGKLIKLSSRDDPWLETLLQLHGPFQEGFLLFSTAPFQLRSRYPWLYTQRNNGRAFCKRARLRVWKDFAW